VRRPIATRRVAVVFVMFTNWKGEGLDGVKTTVVVDGVERRGGRRRWTLWLYEIQLV